MRDVKVARWGALALWAAALSCAAADTAHHADLQNALLCMLTASAVASMWWIVARRDHKHCRSYVMGLRTAARMQHLQTDSGS